MAENVSERSEKSRFGSHRFGRKLAWSTGVQNELSISRSTVGITAICWLRHGSTHKALWLQQSPIAWDGAGGRKRGLGPPPYGYCDFNGWLVPVLSEQTVLGIARGLRNSGWSLPKIKESLEKSGHAPRNGKYWSLALLTKMVGRGP